MAFEGWAVVKETFIKEARLSKEVAEPAEDRENWTIADWEKDPTE